MKRIEIETAGWIRTESDAESVEVTFSYDPADPLAVRVRVVRDAGEHTWVFARDLLADGLRSMTPVGEGQVQVAATSVLTEITHADVTGEQIVLRAPWWNTREFVRLCQAEVPRGHEVVDVDAWVAALTAPQD